MTDTPGGSAVTQFASGTSVVYVVFDYSDVQNDEIRVRVYDNVGNVLFEQVKVYTGSGTESIAISPEVEAFADGRYLTNLYSGLFPIGTIIWDVTPVTGEATHTPTLTPTSAQPMPTLVPGQPTPTPMPPTLTPTPVLPRATGNGVATATLTSQVPGHCSDHGHVGFQRQFLIDLLLLTSLLIDGTSRSQRRSRLSKDRRLHVILRRERWTSS